MLLLVASCSRCYECEQRCAYCRPATNATISIKVCANNSSGFQRVDSVFFALKDSGYTCNLLQDVRNVCDNKNNIDEAISFFQKQDYFCFPKE